MSVQWELLGVADQMPSLGGAIPKLGSISVETLIISLEARRCIMLDRGDIDA